MGVGVSHWRLAGAVSRLGQLGVVSGTALDQILVRRLQDGDPGGHVARGLLRFPVPELARRIWSTYYIAGGKRAGAPYPTLPMHTVDGPPERQALDVVANYVEVTLAREGHGNPVGINYLEKIQIPHLSSLYGALLAGVGVVLVGAGIPARIPGVIDRLVRHEPARYPLHVAGGSAAGETAVTFDPGDVVGRRPPPMPRPAFLAIVASHVLAAALRKKADGRIDGFVVEGPAAGGHNAPPRGPLRLDDRGGPVYGDRDRVDLEKLRALGLPFWLAGAYGSPDGLREARRAGADGVQVGTAFALCADSGLRPGLRRALLDRVRTGTLRVRTEPVASPTGFPFKVADLEGTLSQEGVYRARPRICDLGYLRQAYLSATGAVEFRCPSEPVTLYASKGGAEDDTRGRKCICNALIANIGYAQVRAGQHVEPPLVTLGDDAVNVGRFLPPGSSDYTAADVIRTILGGR